MENRSTASWCFVSGLAENSGRFRISLCEIGDIDRLLKKAQVMHKDIEPKDSLKGKR